VAGTRPAMTQGNDRRYFNANVDKPGHDGRARPIRPNQAAVCCNIAGPGQSPAMTQWERGASLSQA
jgi:hypothetical protein